MDQIEKSYRILSKHPPAMFVGDFISNISQLTGTKQKDPSFGKKSLQVASFLTFFAVFFPPLKGILSKWLQPGSFFFQPFQPHPKTVLILRLLKVTHQWGHGTHLGRKCGA